MASEDGSSFNCGSFNEKTFLATLYFTIPFDTLEAVILDLYSSIDDNDNLCHQLL